MTDTYSNFIYMQVIGTYDDTDTEITVDDSSGLSYPVNLTWFQETDYPNAVTDPNIEVVRVTNAVGNVLTLTRSQEGTAASVKNTSGKTYRLIESYTAKMVTDIQSEIDSDITTHASNADSHHTQLHDLDSHNPCTLAELSADISDAIIASVAGTEILSNKSFSDSIDIDTIDGYTAGSGVTIEGIELIGNKLTAEIIKVSKFITINGSVYNHKHPLKFLRTTAYDWEAGSSASDRNWKGICWSPDLSLFVALSTDGTSTGCMTSPDGVTWTTRAPAENNEWRDVCWSPELGIFCAVAGSGTNRVMTSSDGITWTARAASAIDYWRSISWSPELGLFAAVASTNYGVMTSPDGETWTSRTTGANNLWMSVCWSPELSLFCAISASGTGNRVMTSSDGITWTAGSSALNNNWHGICWSPELNLFVAVSNTGTNRVMTSPDGLVWTARAPASTNNWTNVCWSPELSLFCAVSDSGSVTNAAMTSPDGIIWTSRITNTNEWYKVCWSSKLSMFCAISTSGTGNRVMITNSARSLVYMNEITTPTAIAGHGVIYPKSDNKFYYQDGAGVEHEVVIHIDNTIQVPTKTPSSASDTGTTGAICWDSNYMYVCTATDTWKRVAITTW